MALTTYINVYKYTSHLASPYIPDAPPTGPRVKGKRQQRDGQTDPGFAPNTPRDAGCGSREEGGPGLGCGLARRRGCRTRAQCPDCQGLSAASEARRPTSGPRSCPLVSLSVAEDLSLWAAGGRTRTVHVGCGQGGEQAQEETGNSLEQRLIFVKMVATGVIMTVKVIAKRLSHQAQAERRSGEAGPRLSAPALGAGSARARR